MPELAAVDNAIVKAPRLKVDAASLEGRIANVQAKVTEAGGRIPSDANAISDAARTQAKEAIQYARENPVQVGAGAVGVATASRDDIAHFLGDAIDGLGSGTEFGKRIALEKLDGLVGYAKEHPFKTAAAAGGVAAVGAAGTYAALHPEEIQRGFEAIVGGIKQSAQDGHLAEAKDQLVALKGATLDKGQEALDKLHEVSGQAWTWAKENPGQALAIGAGGVVVTAGLGLLAAKVARGEAGDLGDAVGKLVEGIEEHPVQSAAVATALGLGAAGVAEAKAIEKRLPDAFGQGQERGRSGPEADVNATPPQRMFEVLHRQAGDALNRPLLKHEHNAYTPLDQALRQALAITDGEHDAASLQIHAAAQRGLGEVDNDWTRQKTARHSAVKTVFILSELAHQDLFARSYGTMRRLAIDAHDHPTYKSPDTRTVWNRPAYYNLMQVAEIARPLAEQGDALSQKILKTAETGLNGSGATANANSSQNTEAYKVAAQQITDLLPDNRSMLQKLFG